MKRFVRWLVCGMLCVGFNSALAADASSSESTETARSTSSSEDMASVLAAFNERRKKETIAGMSFLISWGAVSLGSGTVGWLVAEDEQWKGFHRSNITWGAINLGIGLPALVMTLKQDPGSYGLGASLRESYNFRLSHGFNAGLDVGYMVAGAWLMDKGAVTDDQEMVGLGRSMVIQGGVLLVYDMLFLIMRQVELKRLMAVPVVGETLGIRAMGRF